MKLAEEEISFKAGCGILEMARTLANIPGLARPSSTLYRVLGQQLHPNHADPMLLPALMATASDEAPTARARQAFAGGYLKIAKGMLRDGEPAMQILECPMLDVINSPVTVADQATNICRSTTTPQIKRAAAEVLATIIAEHAVDAPAEVGQWARYAASQRPKRGFTSPA